MGINIKMVTRGSGNVERECGKQGKIFLFTFLVLACETLSACVDGSYP